jgi:two-component system chemotaxis sensor kinase CheA
MDEDLELFYEDASEQLQYMENALLDAKDGTQDLAKIGEIFRAMHTIKGIAGMFDFTNIVSFTHIAESLLDEVRNGKVILDSDLASVFMEVKDITSFMVEKSVNSEEYPQELLDNVDRVVKNLSNYNSDNASTTTTSVESEVEELDLSSFDTVSSSSEEDTIWHVSVRFDEEFFTSGMDIISILRYFNKLGEILLNIPIIDKIPTIEEIDPLKTYIGFEIDFQSNCEYEEIEEIFEFVEDDVELFIFRHNESQKFEELFTLHPEVKKLLIDNGIYSENNTTPTAVVEEQDSQEKTIEEQVVLEQPTIPVQETPKTKVEDITPVKMKKSSTLRVDSNKVDLLINMMGEMVIQNSKLMQMAEDRADDDLEEVANSMNALLEEVRDGVMDIRMVQVKDSFTKFKRIVNDTSKKLGKDIDFIIEGEETELDKSVVEKLSDPLVHMLRNSIDHGVEMPDVRVANGKRAKGTVVLRAYPDSGMIVIEIEDDGAGINKEVVLNKAIKNGVVKENDHLSDKEIYKLIFSAGLSTAEQVSDISGRGVGMDVVKKNIEDLRGIIDIDSTAGKGSKFTIRLPLTLAVIDGLLVQAGDTKYIVPLDMISECIELTDEYKSEIDGANTINLRGDILPLIDIRKTFDEKIYEGIRKNVVIVNYAKDKIGLQVDELYGEQQTVIKPLGEMFKNISELSGGAILGSGEVALIFDIPKLVENQIKTGE